MAIRAVDFIAPAKALGFNTWAGVPCSFLTPFINNVIDDPEMVYISSANEGDAVATATGAALAGKRTVAMMQNSGLGNAVSPLSSLNWVFRIPILLIITLRGEPGLQDEPQHELMGQITGRILDELQIPWDWFPRQAEDVEGALMVANWQMERTGLPYALIMRKGSVEPAALNSRWSPRSAPAALAESDFYSNDAEMTRQQALRLVVEGTPLEESIVIGTTGFTGRELFAIEDRSNQLYMVGSMGCASSLGLGLSLALPGKQVLVADGDGAVLMRMGNLATIGAYGGENFRHLVLDNGVHDSTGGQSTVSRGVSFAAIARACGYGEAAEALTSAQLQSFLQGQSGPSFLQLKTKPGVPDELPRPDVSPRDVKQRLMHHLGVDVPWSAL
jgi:phosphonopyruvate decarboxylase